MKSELPFHLSHSFAQEAPPAHHYCRGPGKILWWSRCSPRSTIRRPLGLNNKTKSPAITYISSVLEMRDLPLDTIYREVSDIWRDSAVSSYHVRVTHRSHRNLQIFQKRLNDDGEILGGVVQSGAHQLVGHFLKGHCDI